MLKNLVNVAMVLSVCLFAGCVNPLVECKSEGEAPLESMSVA